MQDLGYGEHEFTWEVTYCDQKVSSKITVIREKELASPAVAASVTVCEGEPVAAITATGEGLEWYKDATLNDLVHKGNSYQPSGEASETLYVVQRNERCSSSPASVSIIVHPKPEPPLTSPVEACVEVAEAVLTADGSRLRWYADAQKQQLLA